MSDPRSGPSVRSCGPDPQRERSRPQRTFAEWADERGATSATVDQWEPANDTPEQVPSPLERKLLGALIGSGQFRTLGARSDLLAGIGAPGLLARQLPVSIGAIRYYLDFAAVAPGRDLYLAIEVDGFDAHDRTREQTERDRRRDRRLTAAGWTVIRFAGREVWRDPAHCASELVGICRARQKR